MRAVTDSEEYEIFPLSVPASVNKKENLSSADVLNPRPPNLLQPPHVDLVVCLVCCRSWPVDGSSALALLCPTGKRTREGPALLWRNVLPPSPSSSSSCENDNKHLVWFHKTREVMLLNKIISHPFRPPLFFLFFVFLSSAPSTERESQQEITEWAVFHAEPDQNIAF